MVSRLAISTLDSPSATSEATLSSHGLSDEKRSRRDAVEEPARPDPPPLASPVV